MATTSRFVISINLRVARSWFPSKHNRSVWGIYSGTEQDHRRGMSGSQTGGLQTVGGLTFQLHESRADGIAHQQWPAGALPLHTPPAVPEQCPQVPYWPSTLPLSPG